jgi:hypothetical protein
LFVEQLLPGLDPVAHGHGDGPCDRGCVEIDLFSRARVPGNDASAADDVAGGIVKDPVGGPVVRGTAFVVLGMPRPHRRAHGRSVVASSNIAGLSL